MIQYNRSWAEAEYTAGRLEEMLFFWGHHSSPGTQINASCLSQWWPVSFRIDGQQYQSAEHWMMCEKARTFGDHDAAAMIAVAPDAKEAKRLGRSVKGFTDEVWNELRCNIVFRGNLEKFAQNPLLKRYLVSTGETILVEASPHDVIWGIGLDRHDVRAKSPTTWRGLNLLGFSLMRVRQTLRI